MKNYKDIIFSKPRCELFPRTMQKLDLFCVLTYLNPNTHEHWRPQKGASFVYLTLTLVYVLWHVPPIFASFLERINLVYKKVDVQSRNMANKTVAVIDGGLFIAKSKQGDIFDKHCDQRMVKVKQDIISKGVTTVSAVVVTIKEKAWKTYLVVLQQKIIKWICDTFRVQPAAIFIVVAHERSCDTPISPPCIAYNRPTRNQTVQCTYNMGDMKIATNTPSHALCEYDDLLFKRTLRTFQQKGYNLVRITHDTNAFKQNEEYWNELQRTLDSISMMQYGSTETPLLTYSIEIGNDVSNAGSSS